MSKASDKPLEKNPTLSKVVMGFDENGGVITMSLSDIKRLFNESVSTGVSNYYLAENTLANGSFTSNSLEFESTTTLKFFNTDSNGISQLDFFQLLSNNKEDVFLKIRESGQEINAVFRITNVVFNTDSTTSFTVELYQGLKRGSFALTKVYDLDFSIENYQPNWTQTDDTKGDFIIGKPFSTEQEARLKDSVYENLSQSISVSPTSFEKGVETDLVFTWRVTKNDDTLNTVTVDGQDKLSEATGVNRTYNVNNQVNSKTVSLVTGYTRNNTTGGSGSVTNSATSTARIPQFYGLLDTLEPSDYEYDTLNSSLTKYVGTSTTFNIVTISSTPKYVVFITTKSNASIEESGFGVSVGDFNSTSGFWKKQVSITLADGSNQTLYIYVSSEPLTTINHKLS